MIEMRKNYERAVVAAGAACLLLWGATVQARGPRRQPSWEKPLFGVVQVAPFAIEPEPRAGVPLGAAQQERIRVLSEQVTQHTDHWLFKKRLSGTIAGGEQRATSAADEATPVVSGVVRLPLSLPADLQQRYALFSRQRFATATVTVQLPAGTKIEAAATPDGKESLPTERLRQQLTYGKGIVWVLERFAEKAVDRALESLWREVRTRRRPAASPTGDGAAS